MIIKVYNKLNLFIEKCRKYNIDLFNIKYKDDYLLVYINKSDYDKIVKLCYFSNISIYKYKGLKYFKLLLKKYFIDLLMILLFIILIYLQSNIIIDIDIIHENKLIKNKVKELLNDNNIKEYTFVKSNKELNKISDYILNNNRDKLDFISITRKGMKYIINIEERIITNIESDYKICDVIANKDGIITNINIYKGISNVEKGMFVHKGDILISKDIVFNDSIKNQICASGDIYANTWYKVNISYPREEISTIESSKYHYNIIYKDKYLLKHHYKNYKELVIFKSKKITIIKEIELININNNLNDDSLKEHALNEARIQLLNKINQKGEIIDEKVLKEMINDSKIELDIFFSVKELISIQIESGLLSDNE